MLKSWLDGSDSRPPSQAVRTSNVHDSSAQPTSCLHEQIMQISLAQPLASNKRQSLINEIFGLMTQKNVRPQYSSSIAS